MIIYKDDFLSPKRQSRGDRAVLRFGSNKYYKIIKIENMRF